MSRLLIGLAAIVILSRGVVMALPDQSSPSPSSSAARSPSPPPSLLPSVVPTAEPSAMESGLPHASLIPLPTIPLPSLCICDGLPLPICLPLLGCH